MRTPLRAFLAIIMLAGCAGTSRDGTAREPSVTLPPPRTVTFPTRLKAPRRDPPPRDIYRFTRPSQLAPVVKRFPPLVYVPNSLSNTVDVIDQRTYRVVGHFATDALPQHVVPSWDLKTLYATNDKGNTLTPIDPATGRPGPTIPVEDPYNLYFTPDGKHAIVVAERLQRLDFRDPHSFVLTRSLRVDCLGVDHLDFSADGRYLIASCEFSGRVVKVDVRAQKVVGSIALPAGAKPQDVKVDPTGRDFYVADMTRGGVYTVDGDAFRVTGFIPTGAGAHGLYVSRDSKVLYVTNRDAGTVSLLAFAAANHVTATWTIPGGGSPDMGGVSADGKYLWLSGRRDAVVYVFATTSGAVVQRIPVGAGPHGLCVYPQPGRYSLGHTGVFR
jgi:DNA-binding beta-propeller fold protein YncE